MKKKYLIFNTLINNYYTGYNFTQQEAWSINVNDAMEFDSDDEIDSFIKNIDNDCDKKDIFEYVNILEIKIIYKKY